MPHRPKADPVGLGEDSHWHLLHQCLTDTRLDVDVRAAGAIPLLFGQHLTPVAALFPIGPIRLIYSELRERYGGAGSWAWVQVRAILWTASAP